MGVVRQVVALVALGGLACEPRQSASSVDSVPAASTDTVVRRVARVTRRATSMQRVTGALAASRALQPLDSVLVVRVLDQRGDEMAGVSVRWALANAQDEASLRVMNERTDSLGLSRAVFTPGRAADPQSVVVAVPNVGQIYFTVTIAPAALRVAPERLTLWSGDDEVVGAQITDAAGHELPGGMLSWGSTDTSVLRVRSEDQSHARVTGALAGRANLVAWIGDGTVRGHATAIVRPVVIGRIVTLDGRPAPAMRMEIRAGATHDSIAVVNGHFTERVELPTDTEVDVRASTVGDSSSYHPVHVRVGSQRDLQNLAITLVPRAWRIDAGTYAGQEVVIDAARAMQRAARGSPYWRLVPLSGRDPRRLLGWRESDLPLHIAFSRERSRDRISAEDSTAFWAIARQMERDLGMTVFEPANLTGDTSRTNLVPVEISAQASDGHTFVTWAQAGNANDGLMLFRQSSLLHDSHIVTHELLHLLGFGHTLWWPTVSQPIGGRERRLTPEDVAYVQLAMRLRRLQEQTGARPGLPIASQ